MFLAELNEGQFDFNPHLKKIKDRFPSAKVHVVNDENTIANMAIVANGRLLHIRTAGHLLNQGYAKEHLTRLIRLGIVNEAIVKPNDTLGMKLMVGVGFYPDGRYKLLEEGVYTETYYNVWKKRINLPDSEECLFSEVSKVLVEESITITAI